MPVVHNKAFQAFNDIQKLKWGDLIEITTAEGLYVYRVDKVYRAKAHEVTVPIAGTEKRLFLATCNSFGSTDDRYIVEAELFETNLFFLIENCTPKLDKTGFMVYIINNILFSKAVL